MIVNPRPASLELHHREPHFCVAIYGCLVAIVWGRVVEGVDLERVAEAQREVIAEWGHCVVVSVIRVGLEMNVKDEVREASLENMHEFSAYNLGSALVAESGGFRAVFFRSVITSIQLLSRSPVKQKVFTTIGDAVGWLLGRPGIDPKLANSVDHATAAVTEIADEYGLN